MVMRCLFCHFGCGRFALADGVFFFPGWDLILHARTMAQGNDLEIVDGLALALCCLRTS